MLGGFHVIEPVGFFGGGGFFLVCAVLYYCIVYSTTFKSIVPLSFDRQSLNFLMLNGIFLLLDLGGG